MSADLWAHGFVALPRRAVGIIGDPLALALYTVILQRVRYDAGPVMTDRGVLDLEVGQCVVGREELARILKSTPSKIRTALNRLRRCQIITTSSAAESASRGTVVSLVNPARYVGRPEAKSPDESPDESPGRRQDVARTSPENRHDLPLTSLQLDRGTTEQAPVTETGDTPTSKPKSNGIEVKAHALAISAAEAFTAVGQTAGASSKNMQRLTKSLARSGATPDQVREVIAAKAAEWLGTTMAHRVVPSTLLAAKNFDKYLEEDVPRWRVARANGAPMNRAGASNGTRDPRRGQFVPTADTVYIDSDDIDAQLGESR